MHSSHNGWEAAATGTSVGYRQRRPPSGMRVWWQSRQWSAPPWQAWLAAALLIGLMATFHQVVTAGVSRAEARHLADRTHGDSLWRCQMQTSRSLRTECQRQLGADPDAVTASK